jgi:alcohol dehydrogenase
MRMMNAAVFTGPGRIALDRKPVPLAGPGEAVVKVTMTTICGTDVWHSPSSRTLPLGAF